MKRLKAGRLKLISARSNARFRSRYPDEPMPPLDLMVDAHAHASYQEYWDSGTSIAAVLVELFMMHHEPNGSAPIRILEWGCGSGRVLRHLRRVHAPGTAVLHGSDYNPTSIDWCRQTYRDIGFSKNEVAPPLPLADHSVDFTYAISVLTHLPDDLCRAWMAELNRVTRPGGLILFTTGGWPFRTRYRSKEQAAYRRGEPIYRGWDEVGRRDFFAWHPPQYVRQVFLAGLREIEHFPAGTHHELQDFWLARTSRA
ncbi:MAG TPA: class I SAM-dependent methyltransferase [Gemmatimonadaceae bacterium]